MKKYENKYFIFDRAREINLKYYLKNTAYKLEALFYKLLLNIYHPHKDDKKKYNVSICAIFKNEGPYLKEWIEFHKIIGVDHFYLYNNFSSDNYEDILKPYIEDGLIDLIDWPVEQGQIKAYQDCIKRYKNTSKWIGFIDIDEFIVPIKFNTVYKFLSQFENNRPVVLVYWKLFGSSGIMNRDMSHLVSEDFTVCWNKYDEVGKCFFNTNYEFATEFPKNKILNHYMWAKYKNIELPPVNCCDNVCVRKDYNPVHTSDFDIQINHYFTKSYEEYAIKKLRGDAFFKLNPRDSTYFFRHDMLCQSVDYHIYKYLIKLKIAMGTNE